MIIPPSSSPTFPNIPHAYICYKNFRIFLERDIYNNGYSPGLGLHLLPRLFSSQGFEYQENNGYSVLSFFTSYPILRTI